MMQSGAMAGSVLQSHWEPVDRWGSISYPDQSFNQGLPMGWIGVYKQTRTTLQRTRSRIASLPDCQTSSYWAGQPSV